MEIIYWLELPDNQFNSDLTNPKSKRHPVVLTKTLFGVEDVTVEGKLKLQQ